eukprot:PhM_4_TR5703/c0_g1_i1/m.94739/K03593/mrp, NUBPL; ATP-binding protein involved in chromosome partitioning
MMGKAMAHGAKARTKIPGIKNVIAVSSAKGGVGKSTLSVNLALALKNLGFSTALMDADINGPSIPTMMNVKKEQIEIYGGAGNERFVPTANYGVTIMSMGLVVPPDEAVALRGPMVNKYLRALLFQTDWGEKDCLLIDMPPGTHDIHLTLTQEVGMTGAVIVSTPQDIAWIDAKRGIELFSHVNVPILGVVQNMAYFTCEKCSEKHYLFEGGGAEDMCKELDLPFLGNVPFLKGIQVGTDKGTPSTLRGDASLPTAQPYYEIATLLMEKMKSSTPAQEPKVTFE